MSWRDRGIVTDDVVFFRYCNPGYEQTLDEAYIWDLDKTYLDTHIDSLTKLFVAAVERAFSKKNIPGTNILLQILAQAWSENHGQSRPPLFFITASPPQLEERIIEKFLYDDIKPLGCFFKDNLRNLRPKRLWLLTKQVGYKLQALLQLRMTLKDNVRQVLWGDDSESDAVIYNLYSDICSRRSSVNELRVVLKAFAVSSDQIDTILALQSKVPIFDPVEKIYINLAIDTDPDYYLKFGRRTVPTYNSFQIALDLYQDQRISLEALQKVSQDLIYNYSFTPDELNQSFDDLVRRRVLGERACDLVSKFFKERKLFEWDYKPSISPLKEDKVVDGRVYSLAGNFEPWVPERQDYLTEYR